MCIQYDVHLFDHWSFSFTFINHSWYYIRPNCIPGDGSSKLGVDYFLSEEDAIESAVGRLTIAKLQQSVSNQEIKSANSNTIVKATTNSANENDLLLRTPANCRTKPQDPAIPLLSSPECSSESECDPYEWGFLWARLMQVGWTRVKAGKYNRLHDWYYVRPGRDPGHESTELNRHYFASQDDVIAYAKQMDEDRLSGKKARKSMGVIGGAFEEAAQWGD